MSRKCLAIGVSNVDEVDGVPDKFDFLDGAIVAAETIGQWALNSGFAPADVRVLTDKGTAKVTDQSLRDAFDALLPAGSTTDHLIVSFTGHGLTGINDDTTYWLMSDSINEGYQIFVEDMRRQLYAYGVQHLTIFSDACRAIANTRNLRDLLARPGVRKRNVPPSPAPQVARFNACQDAASAFQVRVVGAAAPGKCIFSGVLTEALWGQVPDAFEGTVVDSASLGRGLLTEAKKRATLYNQTLVPGGNAFFDKVVYFDKSTPPLPPNPALAPWPPATAVASTAGPKGPGLQTRAPNDVFKSILLDKEVRTDILGSTFGASHPDIDVNNAFPGLPDAAKPLVENLALARRRLEASRLSLPDKNALTREVAGQVQALEQLAAVEARKKKADQLLASLQQAVTGSRDPNVRLVVDGDVKRVWARTAVRPLIHGAERSQYVLSELGEERLLMLEFGDGLFAPIWSYPELVCMVRRDSDGVSAVGYRIPQGIDAAANAAAVAISELITGSLSVEKLQKLATGLPWNQRIDPAFGAISAYCFDVTGDENSIRRMAAYYSLNGQPAPYDLIFLGMMENDGKRATVPAVPTDSRRPKAVLPNWLTAATPTQTVAVAGRCPWLRQGWDFLSSPEDIERPLVGDLAQFRPHLKPSAFTTLDGEGGRRLAEIWELQPSPEP